jgi:hypothetical protein
VVETTTAGAVAVVKVVEPTVAVAVVGTVVEITTAGAVAVVKAVEPTVAVAVVATVSVTEVAAVRVVGTLAVAVTI